MVRIRCTKERKVEFKRYAAAFDTYDEALESLLDAGKRLDELRRDKIKV